MILPNSFNNNKAACIESFGGVSINGNVPGSKPVAINISTVDVSGQLNRKIKTSHL